jgi:hypothetical protein
VQSSFAACFFLIIKRLGSKSKDPLSALLGHIQDLPNDQLGPEHLALSRRLRKLIHHEVEDIVTCVVDRSLQWVAPIFSSGTEDLENALKFTDELGALLDEPTTQAQKQTIYSPQSTL